MSLLAIQLPPRPRLGPRMPGADAAAGPAPPVLPAQWAHVFSADGRTAGPLRRAPAAALPKADQVVLVLAAADVSWHRARLPKAPAARMRLALLGTLEELLLEEADSVHLALAAGTSPGQHGWVAATHAPHLRAGLAALEAAGVPVARMASALPAPGGPLRAHFSGSEPALAEIGPAVRPESSTADAAATYIQTHAAWHGDDSIYWTVSSAEGAWHLPLHSMGAGTARPGNGARSGSGSPASPPVVRSGGLAAALQRALPTDPLARCTCTPAAATAAEAFLGRPVPVLTAAEHLLEAAQSATNLRQFELQPRHRGWAALGNATRQFGRSHWRTARWGLGALAAVQLLGLNVAAWQQQQALQARRSAMEGLLRSTFPDQRTVLDARAQMQSQTQRLRAAAGQPGPADLESALAAAAGAWPAGKAGVSAIRYEAARLTLASPGWQPEDVAALRQRLAPGGWTVDQADTLLTLQHPHSGNGAQPR